MPPTTGTAVAAEDARLMSLQQIVAALALVVIGANVVLPVGRLSSGLVLALALAPVTLQCARRHRWMPWLLGVGLLAIALGLWLALRPGLHVVDSGRARESLFGVAFLLLGTCVVLWARTLLPLPWVGVLYGVGLVAGISPGSANFASNPWKFGFAVPVAVIALSWAWRAGSRRLELVLVLVLAAVSALNDSRSLFGQLLLTAMVLAWSARRRPGLDRRWVGSLLVVLLAFGGIYKATEVLILDGYLGQATQQRSEAQVQSAGSLILGGRPELGATAALMRAHPLGFGVGAVPSTDDVRVGKSGMSALGYQPDNGYVENYMFGTKFQLHSSIGDLWADYGLLGIVLALSLLVLTLTGLARHTARSTAHALVLFLGLRLVWDLFFSPIGTSVPTWVLFLGLVLLPRPGAAPEVPDDVRTTGEATSATRRPQPATRGA